MHHEPIYQGIARPDQAGPGRLVPVVSLPDAHRQMQEFLAWIDPQLLGALAIVDRFPEIYADGKRAIASKLRTEIMRIHGHL